MGLIGKIQALYLDRKQTQPIFPITKTKAVSNDEGTGLDAILEEKASKDYVQEKILEVQAGGVDLSAYAKKEYVNDEIGKIDFPVDSVNGKTGVVQLSASDVKAREDTWTPTASDVGARPDTWFPTIAEIGAAPVINIGNYTGDIDDVNALPVNSVAWVTTTTVNNPRASYGIIETWGSTNTIRNQRITYTDGGMCQRMRFNSKWTAWEWVNPSMSASTEYLTSETWNGKPVYAQVKNFGALPNKTTASVNMGAANVEHIIEFHGSTSNGRSLPYFHEGTASLCCWKRSDSVISFNLYTDHDASSLTAVVMAKYTKTTD